jgi:hypothetical protein
MPKLVQILYVKSDKTNPQPRVRYVGGMNPDGTRWNLSEDAAIAGMKVRSIEDQDVLSQAEARVGGSGDRLRRRPSGFPGGFFMCALTASARPLTSARPSRRRPPHRSRPTGTRPTPASPGDDAPTSTYAGTSTPFDQSATVSDYGSCLGPRTSHCERERSALAPRHAMISSNWQWYRHPGSNGGPLDPQSSALTN